MSEKKVNQIRLPDRQGVPRPQQSVPRTIEVRPPESATPPPAEFDKEIDRIAVILRNGFRQRLILQQSVWHPNNDLDLPTWDRELPPGDREFWRSLAVQVRQRKIEPLSVPGLIFWHGDLIKPPGIYDMTLQNYDKAARVYDEELRLGLIINTNEFAVHFGVEAQTPRRFATVSDPNTRSRRIWASLLFCDSGPDLCPVFRCALALQLADTECAADEIGRRQFLDAANRWVPEAALIYTRSPSAYDRVWQRLLPARFRAGALRAYRKLFLVPDDVTL